MAYDSSANKWTHGILGFLYFAWGVVQLILIYGTDPCPARWSLTTTYRGPGTDDLDLGVPFGGQYKEDEYTAGILMAVAFMVLGLGYFFQAFGDEMDIQINNRLRPTRWVILAIVQGLMITTVSFYAAVLEMWLFIALGVSAIYLNYAQFINEAINSDTETKTGDQTGKSMFSRIMLVDYFVATCVWVFIGIVWLVHMINANSVHTGAIAIVCFYWITYFVLHVLILFWTTNYNTDYWEGQKHLRELPFIIATFIMMVVPSIIAYADTNIDGGDCPR